MEIQKPIFLLKPVFISLFILTRSEGSGPQQNVECSNPPPGILKMTRGVDIAHFDLMPLQFSAPDGYKSPVITFSCAEGRVFQRGSSMYTMPDQVWITSHPGGELNANVLLYKNSTAMRTRMSLDVGVMGFVRKFAFASSSSYKKLQQTITEQSRYISDVSTYISLLRVDHKADWQTRINFQAEYYLDNIVGNRTYESDPEIYQGFIDRFGTHYFTWAMFGGRIRSVFETNIDYFFFHTDEEVKSNAKILFLDVISGNAELKMQSSASQGEFEAMSERIVKYYGGSANLNSPKGVENWQPSIEKDPWLLSGMLKPIADLFLNTNHRDSMNKAVQQHIFREYLAELKRLYNPPFRSKELDTIKNRLKDMEAQTLGMLVESDLETLGKDIETQITVPSWFFTSAQLCYMWYPQDDRGTCFGRNERRFCMPSGSTTSLQRSESDTHRGGCRTHWALLISNADSWFSDIKVCICWHGIGEATKCDDGGLLCIPINRYSSEIPDETSSVVSPTSSEMSWKIKAPESAPLWMRSLNLCFSWYPEGSCAACGQSKTKTMCVTTEKWTAYYKPPSFKNSGFLACPYASFMVFSLNILALLITQAREIF